MGYINLYYNEMQRKRIILILSLPIVLLSTPLNESFTNTTFPPLGWSVINNDGGLYTWERYTTNPRTLPACVSSKFEGSGIRNDDWLITPKLICSDATADTLKFWYRKSLAGGLRESLEVRLSTTGNNVSDFTTILWVGSFSVTTYTQKIIPLDNFDGQEVYIAFVNKGKDQARINIDDITGPEIVEIRDVGVDTILSPTSSFVMRPFGIGFQPQVRIKNFSTAVQRNIPVICSIIGQGNILHYQNIKYIDSLLIDGSKIILFDSFVPIIAEVCTIKVRTLLANDTNSANNCKVRATKIIRGQYSGGPDANNFYWIDSDTTGGPIYNWIDISQTGVNLPTGNEYISSLIPLDFIFSYYGVPYTHFRYSTNGFISLGDLYQAYNFNAPIPNANFPNNIIAPFWDDLWTIGAWHQIFGSAPNRYKIIQWNAVVWPQVLRDTVIFQIILHESGDIIFQYNRCDNRYNLGQGQTATIGIENAMGTTGLQYLYNGEPQGNLLSSGRAIRFYRVCHDVMLDSILTTQVGLGDTVNPKVLVKNIGTYTESFLTIFNIFNNTSLIYVDTLEVNNLQPSASCTLSFDNWIAPRFGTYTAKAWTTLENDFNRTNDTCYQNIEVSIATPILLHPTNGLATNMMTILFDWTDILGATRYNFQLINHIDTIIYSSQYGPINLSEGIYYWQVRAGNQTQWGHFSPTYAFTIDITPPSAPILVNPVPNCTIFSPNPYFIWRSNSDAFIYNLVVYSAFDTVINITLSDTTYISSIAFGNSQYFWKVRCQDRATNWSDFSSEQTFFVSYTVWQRKANIPTYFSGKSVKAGGCLVAAGNKLYALKGNNTREFYVYDIATNQWQIKCSIPFIVRDSLLINRKVKAGASLVWDGNFIYALKGNNTKEFWAYDFVNDSWFVKNSVPAIKGIRDGSSLTYYNGAIYCLVGASPYYEFYRYDVNQDTWISLSPAPEGRYRTRFKSGSCIVYGGQNKIFALKGGSKYNEFYAYDINNNLWTEKESLPYSHLMIGRKTKVKTGTAMTYDGQYTIYATKGCGKNEFWKFNTATERWSPMDTIPRLNKRSIVKAGAGLAYADNRVWLLKGNNTSEFWNCMPYNDRNCDADFRNYSTELQNTPAEGQFNFLNPFKIVSLINPQTKIYFTIVRPSNVTFKLYNNQGQLMKFVKRQYENPGNYSELISLDDLPKGIYFIVLNY